MASTYENDLRLEEMATGENSGSWGTKTNTNLELVADAFSYGTEIIANADTAITIADGTADAARSLALKITSSEDLTTTRVITLGPNTTSKVWIIENSTSGGQTLTISAGSGSNVTLPNGVTKIIATDGIGAAANVTELYTNLHNITVDDITVDGTLTVDGILSIADGSNSAPSLTNTGDTNTGLYFPAADEVGITTGGTQRVKVDTTGVDITGTLTVDGTPVRINSTAPMLNFMETGVTDSNHRIRQNAGNLYFQKLSDDEATSTNRMLIDGGTGDITFYDTDGTTASFVYDASAGTTFNDAGANRDFQVKSDNSSSTFYVDGQYDGVGIHSSSPVSFANAQAVLFIEDNVNPSICISDTGQTNDYYIVANGSRLGFIYGVGSNTGGTVSQVDMLSLDNSSGAVFNEGGADRDFRVESDAKEKMLFVDGGENVVAVGMLDNYTTPSWVGNGSFVMADNFYQFQGANIDAGVWNQSVDTNQSYHMHNAYYSSGWKSHVANVAATMYQSGSGLHRFQVANATTVDASISWRPLLNMNEAAGFDWNPSSYSTADFKVRSDSNDNMLFVDAGDNAVCINTNSITTAPLNIQSDSSARAIRIVGRSDDYAEIDFFENDNSTQLVRHQAHNTYYQIRTYAIPLKLATNETNRFIIDVDGRKIMNGASSWSGITGGTQSGSAFNVAGDFYSSRATSSNSIHVRWYNTNGNVGNIATNGSGTVYSTTSDIRLKDNIESIAGGTEKLMAMKPVTHTWIADPEADAVHGFIAQEMMEIVPEAVSGDPDSDEMMSMDYGRITPVLVAALQDAHNKITALEKRLAEMEIK